MKTLFKTTLLILLTFTLFNCGGDDEPDTPPVNTSISNITPNNGPKTTIVTINGQDFGTNTSNVEVFFNEKQGTVQSLENTKIVAIVPARAFTGTVKVIVAGTEVEGPVFNYTITQVEVSTIAGTGAFGDVDGNASTAQFNYPTRLVLDPQGNLYVVDTDNHKIKKITPSGIVSTFAGTAEGDVDGNASTAQFNYPTGLVLDPQGNLYVADSNNNKIKKITPSGIVSTFAGTGTQGDVDGNASTAQFNYPTRLVLDPQGNLYVADYYNHKIKKITPSGIVSTFAGTGTYGDVDGNASTAQFNYPTGLVLDPQGNLYVADTDNYKIRKITPSGIVSTFAGTAEGDVDGNASTAQFNTPVGLALDPQGNLYVADYYNHKIKKITPSGIVSTFAGTGTYGDVVGAGNVAQFASPYGIFVDNDYNVYVTDAGNNKIKKITQE